MALDPDLPNNNQIYDNSYTSRGYEKAKLRKLLFIVVGVILIFFVIIALLPESQQDKYTKSATAAAKKQIPDAKVTNVKVAGGFAIATVSDPSAQGQANAGNTTLFKVNKDGSMVQMANGSSFSPLDLLALGIPLATQAKLMGSNLEQVKQDLANQCGYSPGSLGFSGFDGSFSPGEWQIDSATLTDLERKLNAALSEGGGSERPHTGLICVHATQNNSNATTDRTTYISTFTLKVQFITSAGTLTTHTITFAIGPNHYHKYTLDGEAI